MARYGAMGNTKGNAKTQWVFVSGKMTGGFAVGSGRRRDKERGRRREGTGKNLGGVD